MSGRTTPRTPEQGARGVAPGTPPDQGTQPQEPNAPGRRRMQPTASRGVQRSLNLDENEYEDEDEDEDARRRERQDRFLAAMGRAAGTEPGAPELMNVPELKL